jgi:3-oxoacyl-[acyl-carrier-protein] synthase II
MSVNRVVITGLGAITPIGNDVQSFWDGLLSGKNGAKTITKFDPSELPTQFACEIKDLDITKYMDRKAARRMDLFTQYAMAASSQAIDDSGLDLEKEDLERIGVIYGSGIGGMETFVTQLNAFQNGGARRVSPFFVPMLITDISAGHISIKYGFKGPNYATVSACATSSHALADAFFMIQRGSAEVMVTGGSEATIIPMSIAGFNAARAISTWNDRPEKASRPFDKDRNGFVMGEGAGTLILEEYEHAKARGAKIYAEVVGVGLTADAYHVTAPAPEGEGAYRSMRDALRDGGINPEDVDYINAHGTSTPLNDLNETKAIKKLFGKHAYELSVSSTKSMTGHLLGAAGAVEAIATTLAINNQVIPPTINLDEPDPECDLDYTPLTPKEKEIRYAISNTFGFGGHNASILLKKIED